MPVPALIIQNAPLTPAFTAFATLLALCAGQLIANLYTPRRYPRSNTRAMMRSCPPSSASTAATSPAPDHAAKTASKNAPHGSTPDPRATPHSGDSGTRTACERERC